MVAAEDNLCTNEAKTAAFTAIVRYFEEALSKSDKETVRRSGYDLRLVDAVDNDFKVS